MIIEKRLVVDEESKLYAITYKWRHIKEATIVVGTVDRLRAVGVLLEIEGFVECSPRRMQDAINKRAWDNRPKAWLDGVPHTGGIRC